VCSSDLLVRNGDVIELDAARGLLQLHVSDSELTLRRATWKPRPPLATRGYTRMYIEHVNQAHEGADLDFLVGNSGSAVRPAALTHGRASGGPTDEGGS
jgi:L-arabonate dehydrase